MQAATSLQLMSVVRVDDENPLVMVTPEAEVVLECLSGLLRPVLAFLGPEPALAVVRCTGQEHMPTTRMPLGSIGALQRRAVTVGGCALVVLAGQRSNSYFVVTRLL